MTGRVLLRFFFVVTLIGSGLVTTAAQASQETTPQATPIAPIPEVVAQPGGDLPGDPQMQLVQVADGLVDPVNVTIAPDGRVSRRHAGARSGSCHGTARLPGGDNVSQLSCDGYGSLLRFL